MEGKIKGAKTMMDEPTETAELSKQELTKSELTAGNLHKTKIDPLNVGDSYEAWAVCRETNNGTSIYPQ